MWYNEAMIDLTYIPQRESSDCGIAVLAMLANMSYEDVHKYFIPKIEGNHWHGLDQYDHPADEACF